MMIPVPQAGHMEEAALWINLGIRLELIITELCFIAASGSKKTTMII